MNSILKNEGLAVWEQHISESENEYLLLDLIAFNKKDISKLLQDYWKSLSAISYYVGGSEEDIKEVEQLISVLDKL